ncbi:MAG: glutamine synthetase [Anaeromicrobium sp.]|uniref:glutamine synthetase n=1 Tax=Anaeromicrobium sp. TaxID=1929132 RepID=UPI0025E55BE6|nr:glutamine synthetase [Anaeromicrobium sp.]MCT4595482.1 glutamine synthetase [Anaeromicrobium sp.]
MTKDSITSNVNNLLFLIEPKDHSKEQLSTLLKANPQIKFVSLMGIDLGGNATDEKIPAIAFLDDLDNFLVNGVQTDGSSVVLPEIATLNNAKVDIIPDLNVNWFVDYNFSHIDSDTNLPVGTLRIPSFLVHNSQRVDSRSILEKSMEHFKSSLLDLLKKHPYALENIGVSSFEEVDKLVLTAATELEFWVKTPDDRADVEQLSTSQVLKEQYWKRTIGPVRTAMEQSLLFLDYYGLEAEMGHKEVGGVKAQLTGDGRFSHVMEQLEIDWKYSTSMQAADNELLSRDIIKDVFMYNNLDVTFMAKPVEGVAGNGEHTHVGVALKLKDGTIKNLFSPKDMTSDFMSPVGYGSLMGILKNYEVINPFVTATNDALNRLKPGFEAPICIVSSLGHTPEIPSRNRTILIGLIRDMTNPLATRFELRAPNPTSNTYLVLASMYQSMLDGIKCALENDKTCDELLKELSKPADAEGFYLEKGRAYRSEKDVFDDYTEEERNKLFGIPPKTVWENIQGFESCENKKEVLLSGGVFNEALLNSYKEAILSQWTTELYNRIIPHNVTFVRKCAKTHNGEYATDLDLVNWEQINYLRYSLMKDRLNKKCLFTKLRDSIDRNDFDTASELQIEMRSKMDELRELYLLYKRNLF